MTYDEAVNGWEANRLALGDVREFTAMKSAQEARRLSPWIGGMEIDTIRPSDIEDALIALRNGGNQVNGAGLSQASLRKAHMHGTAACEWAVERDMALANPFHRVKRPKTSKSKASASLDSEDAAYLMDAAKMELNSCMYGFVTLKKEKDAACCMFVIIALSTGMRRGEIIALDWPDVGESHISVSKAVKDNGEIGSPKNDSSVRRVAIGHELSGILAAYREWQSAFSEDAALLASSDGRITPNVVEHWFSWFSDRAGFDGLRIHDMRHTHATLLISSGVDVKTVQHRLGHSSATMTLDVYSHAVPRNDDAAAANMESILGGAR